ncbi:unnamed protein product [Durusdinium trenchii]|uniref:Uncharacterized protein n=2 Tax=Durusdinium trenchii TaxID=1381693 RepID=A0ABP0SXD2_9DINO
MRWLMGVALVLIGLAIGTAGMHFIRISELKKNSGNLLEGRFFFLAGMAMNILVGPAFDVAGYAFAPAAVIAPFTGFNIVINTLVAPFMLGEELTCRRCASAVIVFITATLSIFFKNAHTEVWSLERTEDVLGRPRVVIYGTIFAMWFLLNVWIRARSPHGSVIRGFSLGATAGSLAGNMWCTRVAAALAADCVSGDCAAWSHWIPWVVLAGAVFFAVANVPYMAKGMQKYEALFMVTVFQGSNILSNSLSALIVLQEMDGEPWWKLLGYSSCIMGMMFGLVILVHGEEAPCPDTFEVDCTRMMSLDLEAQDDTTSSESDEPDIIDFLHAVAKDPFTHLSSSTLCRQDSSEEEV